MKCWAAGLVLALAGAGGCARGEGPSARLSNEPSQAQPSTPAPQAQPSTPAPSQAQPSTPAPSQAKPSTPAPSQAGTGGLATPGALHGVAVFQSDVQTTADQPIDRGSVIAIPEAAVSRLWSMTSPPGPPGPDTAHAQFRISPENVRQVGGVVASIGMDGAFKMKAPGGSYLLCLADVMPGQGGSELSVAGCAPVLIGGDLAPIRLTFGEAGVQLK